MERGGRLWGTDYVFQTFYNFKLFNYTNNWVWPRNSHGMYDKKEQSITKVFNRISLLERQKKNA